MNLAHVSSGAYVCMRDAALTRLCLLLSNSVLRNSTASSASAPPPTVRFLFTMEQGQYPAGVWVFNNERLKNARMPDGAA